MEKVAIGIDLGGTNCRVGIVSSDGKILQQELAVVGDARTPSDIIKLLVDNIDNPPNPPLVKGGEGGFKIRGIGIGAPGIVDFKRGVVISSPHYPDWNEFALRDKLSKACGLPVVLDNDANMIARGEGWLGAGRGMKNFIMITLGTGIGGGIVINGEVFHGDVGYAGEIGHMVMQFDGLTCECGGRGCWETIVSIDGLRHLAGKKFPTATPKTLHDMAKKGDPSAVAVWKKFGAYLGAGIASLANVTGIHSYVIGGGISNAWDLFISEAKKEIAKRTYKDSAKRIILKRSALGDTAGIIGAAKLSL